MKKIILVIALLTGWILGTNLLLAQQYIMDDSQSKISLSGTSSLHDWNMRAVTFSADFDVMTNEQDMSVSDVTVRIKTADIKSSKNIMNRKAEDALKVEEYPWIIFDMTEVNSFQTDGRKISGEIVGNLTIAGVTKQVVLPFSGYRTSDNGVLSVEGSIKLDMTDYGIVPPVALLGQVETDDDVDLDYKVTVKKVNK